MPRPQRFCIFCGKPGLTREHVWADWLKRYIPKTAKNHTALYVRLDETMSHFKRKKVDGDLRNRRLRIVCKSCNEGWMSKLQERAKPKLLPLIRGEITVLTTDVQELIATWITMFVMVAEHFDTEKVVSTKREQVYLRKHQKPPPNWKIWIADYEHGDWPGLLAHFAVPLTGPKSRIKRMDNGLPRPNTQTMSFVVGRLYVHARSSATDVFEEWRLARPDKLGQVWPIRRNLIAWPLTSITDREADDIAASFHRASDAVARRIEAAAKRSGKVK